MKTDFHEIDEGTGYIGYGEGFAVIGANVRPVGEEELPLLTMRLNALSTFDI